MTESLRNISEKSGLPPGSLVHVGDVREAESRITLIDYSKEDIVELTIQSVDEILKYKDSDTVTWVIIEGLANVEIVEKIGTTFGIHQLVLEDILNTHQRPKFEEYDDYLYVVLKSLRSGDAQFTVTHEQVSLLVLKNFVFAFKEKTDDLFHSVQQRIRTSKGRIRKMGADYLAYALIDTLVDNYFMVPEKIGEKIESLDNDLIRDPTSETLLAIQGLKTKLIFLRKSVWPLREVIRSFEKTESPLISESTDIYLRDVYDHTIQLIDTIETSRDILSGMLDIYLSSISNKMNQVMKVLTIIATIFIPLTFVAGLYGMNFRYLPELEWKWSYPAVLLIMVFIGIVMLAYFRKKRWL